MSFTIDPKNPFVLTEDSYKRDVFPIPHYVNQAAKFLSLRTKKPFEECKTYVMDSLRAGRFDKVKIPVVKYLHRQENGDRAPQELPLTTYLRDLLKENEIMAPTLTTYVSTDKHESVLAKFILLNIQKRNKAKKAMFAAKMGGDDVEHFFQDLEQRNTKLSNNAISGAHASPSTPLYNQTNHSSLTSHCRMTSGTGNANNEKLLSGNRHYWKPDIVLNNIVSIVQNSDLSKWQEVINHHRLHIPTVEEVMKAIQYSTDLYWQSPVRMQEIEALVRDLQPLERAAFLYTGDLHHLRIHNEAFMRQFIGELAKQVPMPEPDPLAYEHLETYPEDYVNLARQICSESVKGKKKDYKKLKDDPSTQLLLGTTRNIHKTVTSYTDFIEVVFTSDNMPASVPQFPVSVRRSALTSDTDSTIFTVQDWITWFFGKLEFNEAAIGLGAAVVFLASQSIVHLLARMSINAGVARKNMWRTAMKNEFYFPVFVPTRVAKHYFALRSCQEGNVFAECETEIKGVHLKSSNAPKEINRRAEDMMVRIMKKVQNNEKINLLSLVKEVADTEREIMEAVRKGDPRFCRRGEVKTAESYSQEKERSNYMHYIFWKECFSMKYGFTEEPPFAVVRLSGALKSPTETAEWLKRIDPATAERIKAWMVKYNKDKIGSIWIPKQVVDVHGVPAELLEAVAVRKMAADMTKIFSLILETCGFFYMNKKNSRLLSDYY